MTKKVSAIVLIVLLVIIALAIFFSFNPENNKFFLPCLFHHFTGFECPGCGSQRAIHYLLHFEIKEAFLRNPLLVVSMPYLIVGFYFEYMGGRLRHPKTRKFIFGRNAIMLIFCIIVLFWIGRNIVSYNQL